MNEDKVKLWDLQVVLNKQNKPNASLLYFEVTQPLQLKKNILALLVINLCDNWILNCKNCRVTVPKCLTFAVIYWVSFLNTVLHKVLKTQN